MTDDDMDYYADAEAYDLRAEAMQERAALRRWCPTCYTRGGHSPGCPEADEEQDSMDEDGSA